MKEIIVWAIVTKDGDVVGAYTNRVSAVTRIEYLDSRDKFKEEQINLPGRKLEVYRKENIIGPYKSIRCIGTVEDT